MKFLIAIVCFVVLIGAVYGLARFHVIPLAGIAKTSPAVKKLLVSMQLMTLPKPMPAAGANPVSAPAAPDPLAAQKQQLAEEQAAIDQEKAAMARKNAAVVPPPIIQTSPKLIEIYEAMDSDDLATLFSKQPDSAVVSALIGMDTKKAAKALAALPSDRAAKITALMNQAMATEPSTPPQPVP